MRIMSSTHKTHDGGVLTIMQHERGKINVLKSKPGGYTGHRSLQNRSFHVSDDASRHEIGSVISEMIHGPGHTPGQHAQIKEHLKSFNT
jgi:hypothetical protein